MKTNRSTVAGALVAVGVLALVPAFVQAADSANSELSQEITAGALSTSIRDASDAVVASPSFALGAKSVSTSKQTATGTFGSASQRVAVDNPGGANGGWTLAWNATTPGTSEWSDGTNNYKYDDSAANGQLTIDPSAGTTTAILGGDTDIALGSSASFSSATPITLVTAAAGSADIWNGYFTGIGLSQAIPAGQPAGTYTLDMTQTVTAQ